MGLIAAPNRCSAGVRWTSVELGKAIARLEDDRTKAEAENARLPDAIDRAILADENVQVDKLEKKLAANNRVLRKVSLSLPILQRRLFEAEEVRRQCFIAKHRATALGHADAIHAALNAVCAANDRARQIR